MNDLVLYLGGIEGKSRKEEGENHFHLRSSKVSGLNGAISLLRFNRKKLDLFENALIKKNIFTLDTCQQSSASTSLQPLDLCKNDGVCLIKQSVASYKCICLNSSFTGAHCESKINDHATGATKIHHHHHRHRHRNQLKTKEKKVKGWKICETKNPCLNKGKCVDLIALNRNLSESSQPAYRCECFVGFKGVNCSLSESIKSSIEFNGKGFVELAAHVFDKVSYEIDGDDDDGEERIFFRSQEFFLTFTTNQSNGILLFNNELKLQISDGHLVMKHLNNEPLAAVVELRSPYRINNNRLHIVHFYRFENKINLVLDNRVRLNARISSSADFDDFVPTNFYLGN